LKSLKIIHLAVFLDYIGARKPVIKKLDTSLILSKFSDEIQQSQIMYKQFVLGNRGIQSSLKNTFKGFALGDDTFIKKITKKIKSIGENREIKETKFTETYNPDEIIRVVSDCFSINKSEIFKKKRGNIYKQLTLYLIKRYTDLSLREIGELFNMDYTSVSMMAKRFEKKVDADKEVSEMFKEVMKKKWEKKANKC